MPAAAVEVRVVPKAPRQGDTVLVFVAGTKGAQNVEGSLGAQHLAFFPYGAAFAALAGVDLETKPGKVPWRIGLVDGGGVPRKMAVLSNKPVNPSRAIIHALGLGQFFSQVYGGNSFTSKKPDPEGALKLLEESGVRPEQAAIVGDSHVDVRTGRNARLWTIGVNYGFAPHTLADEPPDILVDLPQEVGVVFSG